MPLPKTYSMIPSSAMIEPPLCEMIQEGSMTRQCAWCDCYLDPVQVGADVTHGICDRCAERIRQSMLEGVTPLFKEMLRTTKADVPFVNTELERIA
jgi:hypothetical protein